MRTIKGFVYKTKRRKQIPAEERRLGTNLGPDDVWGGVSSGTTALFLDLLQIVFM